MYKILKNYFSHTDERGEIKGIINSDKWEEINYITTKKGHTRGDHYHKFTRELFYIIQGQLEVETWTTEKNKHHDFLTLKKNDIIVIEPQTAHKFYAQEDSVWINCLSHKMDGPNPDIYKTL